MSLLGLATAATSAVSGQSALVEWRFDRAGDFEGWQPNAHLTRAVVTNGVLAVRTVGSDPILELGSLLDLKASPWQIVDIRLKADRARTAREIDRDNDGWGRVRQYPEVKAGGGFPTCANILPFDGPPTPG